MDGSFATDAFFPFEFGDLLLDKFSVCPTSSVSSLRTLSLEIVAQVKEEVTEYQFLTWAL